LSVGRHWRKPGHSAVSGSTIDKAAGIAGPSSDR
jgi:hypothetical protein